MDYEKKYNKALERAKDMLSYKEVRREDIEYLFPELKESEDEKIRKRLIDFFEDWHENRSHCWGIAVPDILAWIEKQGEQKSADKVEPKFKVGDTIRPKGSLAEYTVESISGGCYHGKGWGLDISCDNDYELVKQGSAWSEEDKEHIHSLLDRLEGMCKKGATFTATRFAVNQDMDWLKSIKQRIGGEQ